MGLIEKVLESLQDDTGVEEQQDPDELASKHFLDVIDAFDMPAWRWNEENKAFEQ